MNLLCLRSVQWLSLGGRWMNDWKWGRKETPGMLGFCFLIRMVIVTDDHGNCPRRHLAQCNAPEYRVGVPAQEGVWTSCLVLEFLINYTWGSWFVLSNMSRLGVSTPEFESSLHPLLPLWPWAKNCELQFLHLWNGIPTYLRTLLH